MTSPTTILLIGDPGGFRNGLEQRLAAEGHAVVCLGAFSSAQDIGGGAPAANAPLRIIFTPTEINEFALLKADLQTGGNTLLCAVEMRVKVFLAQSQAVLKLLMRAGGGQLWVCDYDDSFAYHLETSASPVVAQARAGAVRSLAKECSRMNITINSLFVQPLTDQETATKAMFRNAQAALKSYAMRYRPNTIDDIAGLLNPLLGTERLAFSGAMIGTGTGVLQTHLTA